MDGSVHVLHETDMRKAPARSKSVDDGSTKVFFHGSGQPGRHAEGGVEGRISILTCDAPARGSRPRMEGAIAEPPGESGSATEARIFGSGAPERISRRVAPDAGASAGDRPGRSIFGCSRTERHRMPSSCPFIQLEDETTHR